MFSDLLSVDGDQWSVVSDRELRIRSHLPTAVGMRRGTPGHMDTGILEPAAASPILHSSSPPLLCTATRIPGHTYTRTLDYPATCKRSFVPPFPRSFDPSFLRSFNPSFLHSPIPSFPRCRLPNQEYNSRVPRVRMSPTAHFSRFLRRCGGPVPIFAFLL